MSQISYIIILLHFKTTFYKNQSMMPHVPCILHLKLHYIQFKSNINYATLQNIPHTQCAAIVRLALIFKPLCNCELEDKNCIVKASIK